MDIGTEMQKSALRLPSGNEIKELSKFIISLLLMFFFLRTFVIQSFKVPTSSMYPTHMIGDWLFGLKFSYGFSRYSLPFHVNLFSGRILESKPNRGDVIIFAYPNDTSTYYVKRLIGLPGDTIQMKSGVLHINGKPVLLERSEDFMFKDKNDLTFRPVPQYIETLPGGIKHKILKVEPFGQANKDNTPLFFVPEDHYFFLGDNRDLSADSRYMTDLSFVHKDYLVAKSVLIFFSIDWERNFGGIRWSRIAKIVQ